MTVLSEGQGAIVSVTAAGVSLLATDGGKDHTSHRLVRLGDSTRHAVLLLYAAATAAGLAALALALTNWWVILPVLGVVAGAGVAAGRRLARVGPQDRTPRPDAPAGAPAISSTPDVPGHPSV